MSTFKYTTSGKKVVVIGKLNNAETIVQEIYVTEDGAEIPAGEQFVTKSLLDSPAVTWQEERLKQIEARKKEAEREREKLDAELRKTRATAKEHIAAIKAFTRGALREQLQTAEMFVAGEITHIVWERYRGIEICPFDGTLVDTWDGRIEGVRLVSLFGRSDGQMDWRINEYRDGSGSWCTFVPACGEEEALRIAQEMYDASVGAWKNGELQSPPEAEWRGKPNGLIVPQEVIEWHETKEQKRIKDRIATLEKELGELKSGKPKRGKK
jgi:hypothetical protein